MKNIKLKWWQWGLVGFFGLGVIGSFLPDNKQTNTVQSPTGYATIKQITSHEMIGTERLSLIINIGKVTGGDYAILQSGDYIEKVGRLIKSKEIDIAAAKEVKFRFQIEDKDQLGNYKPVWFWAVTVPSETLNAANYDNLNFAELLDLANKIEFLELGKPEVLEYCLKNKSAFCKTAFTK